MLGIVKQALNSSQEAKTRGAWAAYQAMLHSEALSQQAAPCPALPLPQKSPAFCGSGVSVKKAAEQSPFAWFLREA